jgi:nucleoside phosphorylase
MSSSQRSDIFAWCYDVASKISNICTFLFAVLFLFRLAWLPLLIRSVENTQTAEGTTAESRTVDDASEATIESDEEGPRKKLDRSEYTVGWICALTDEYIAARLFLDEKHEPPDDLPPRDANSYTLGRIGAHNVAIAVLPHLQYGNVGAANVAKDMMHAFASIRVGLMVGIAGGAPSVRNDIRLGDVVVSTATGRNSAVLKYDIGKSIQGQEFRIKGCLSPPPSFLQTAVAGLNAEYREAGAKFDRTIRKKLKTMPKLRENYGKPDEESDRLFKSDIKHPTDDERSCEEVCALRDNKLVPRKKRLGLENNTTIHYGVIASGDSLMKDALFRDKLSKDENILCFEMEAAGLMDQFPCLVIRGICDYADTHKNKQWQGYAALVAAAYAKDLLCQIRPRDVEDQRRISEILRG